MENTALETTVQSLFYNEKNVKNFRPFGLSFVQSSQSFYPQKGEPISYGLKKLWEDIDLEIGKYFGMKKHLTSIVQ